MARDLNGKEIVSSRVSEDTLKSIALIAKKKKWTISFTIEQLLMMSIKRIERELQKV